MEQIKQWYSELQENEQKIVIAIGFVFILVIFIFGLIMPINQSVNQLESKVNKEQRVINTWQESIPKIRANRNQAGGSSNQSLNSIITSSTRVFDLKVSRVQEKGDDQMQVWLDNVPFDNSLRWISMLEKRYKVKVSSINLRNKERNGLVNLDVRLQK